MPTPQHIPLRWLLLDLAGLAMVGAGFALVAGKAGNGHPAIWGMVLMLAGVLCMLPLFWKIRNAVRRVRRQDEEWLERLPEDLSRRLRNRDTP